MRAFLKERIPGFENAKIAQISPVLGVRETRHVVGEYMLTEHDVIDGPYFEDSIAADASALDIHDPKGADVDFRGMRPYEIPYRCLVPKGVEQLLVAGRCISADHGAHARSRNMPACMATGQAAGIAAAVAVEEGCACATSPCPGCRRSCASSACPSMATRSTEEKGGHARHRPPFPLIRATGASEAGSRAASRCRRRLP